VERLRVIAAKCPVHRTLDGEVLFDERVELVEPAAAQGG
jgi:putative redox protein